MSDLFAGAAEETTMTNEKDETNLLIRMARKVSAGCMRGHADKGPSGFSGRTTHVSSIY